MVELGALNRWRYRKNKSAVIPYTPKFVTWEAHLPPSRFDLVADEASGGREMQGADWKVQAGQAGAE